MSTPGIGGGVFGGAGALGTSVSEPELAFTDITTANSTSLKHGLLPKLSGSAADVLKGDGTWAAGGGGVGGSTGATDNRVLRADGTGGATVQNSAVLITDAGALQIPAGQLLFIGLNGYAYSDGVGPVFSDSTGAGFNLTHNIQNLTAGRTVTWPDTALTVLGTSNTATVSNKTFNGLKFAVASKTADYTATASDVVILVDATAGAVTITLPAASTSIGTLLRIKKVDASINGVAIVAGGADTIEGSSLVMLTQYESKDIVGITSTLWGLFASV